MAPPSDAGDKVVQAAMLLSFSACGTLIPLLFVHRLSGGVPLKAARKGKTHSASTGAKAAKGKAKAKSGGGAKAGAHGHGHSHGHQHHEHGHGGEPEQAAHGWCSALADHNRRGEFVAIVLSLGNAFAGGVMLATGLVHILSDALEISLEDRDGLAIKDALYEPLVLALMGVLVPFFLEKSGLTWWLLQHQACFTDHYTDVHAKGHAETMEAESQSLLENSPERGYSTVRAARSKSASLGSLLDGAESGGGGSSPGNGPCTSKCVVPSFSSTRLQGRLDFYRSIGSLRSISYAPLIYPHTAGDLSDISLLRPAADIADDAPPFPRPPASLEPVAAADTSVMTSADIHDHPPKHSHMNFATFLMFLVLSIHSLIVGFTIGTIRTRDPASTTQHTAYVAVAVHKVFESIALGTNAAQNRLSRAVYLELVVYNLAAPLGIVLGTAVQSSGGIDLRTEALVLGLASGSFIYIALVEILADEFENEEYRIAKFVFFAAGSGIMAFLARAD